jgi:retron-type reverse transcriptase
MSDQPTSRQELYNRIRKSSKEAVILEEMIRLGFWPAAGEMPEDPADEIRRMGDLRGRLRALRGERTSLQNEEKLRKEAAKKRMKDALERRKETKARKLAQRAEKADAWRQHKQEHLGYLGRGVSGGLGQTESDLPKLKARGLPELDSAEALAAAMGLSVSALRFLVFTRETSTVNHYHRFTIPKKTGGHRLISAPMPRLKSAQLWLLANVVSAIPPHDAAHGFVPGRSIVSNARPHVGSAVVVNLDLKDFFPTITYKRVKGLIRTFGYSEQLCTVMALLCTEPETTTLDLDLATYHVATTARFLPQGAPTSPAITNLICRGLDARLTAIASRLGMTYTRYADDLTFSSKDGRAAVGRLLRQVGHVVEAEGFEVHPSKTRVLRSSRRQEVTGIVVNEQLGISRKTLRRFRALLHQIDKHGPKDKRWGPGSDLFSSIAGFANFVSMVSPDKGRALKAQVQALHAKHG